MYATISEIPSLNLKKVRFYTIDFEERDSAEFFDFLNRMNDDIEKKKDLETILASIKAIGNKLGAKKKLFKHERKGEALPTFYEEKDNFSGDYGVRLYCIVLSEQIVILLNGDKKTQKDPEKCPNVRKYFRELQSIAKAINEDFKDKVLALNGNTIVVNEEDYFFQIK